MFHVVVFHKSFIVLPIATHGHVLFVACLAMVMMTGDRGEEDTGLGSLKWACASSEHGQGWSCVAQRGCKCTPKNSKIVDLVKISPPTNHLYAPTRQVHLSLIYSSFVTKHDICPRQTWRGLISPRFLSHEGENLPIFIPNNSREESGIRSSLPSLELSSQSVSGWVVSGMVLVMVV